MFQENSKGTLGWRKILFYYKNQLVFRYLHLEHSKKFVVSSCQHLAQSLPKKSLEKSLQFPWDAQLVSTISFIYLFLNSFVYLFILSWQITSVSIHIYIKIAYKLIKGALSGLRQFLATESSLKMMQNAFYFTKSFFRSQDI